MSDAAVTTNSLWKDSYLAYIPLLGAALALTFDFGYFSALNLSFFTLFSLSEHILFAIQAFPVALVFILLGLIVGGILLNFPSLLKSPQPAPPSKQLRGVLLAIAVAVVTMIMTAARLMRAYATQVEVLRRLRNGGQQFVRVEHVHVNDGGQAVIGNVKEDAKV